MNQTEIRLILIAILFTVLGCVQADRVKNEATMKMLIKKVNEPDWNRIEVEK